MARFCVLASSSAGNSTYISCGEGALLVDAGISCRRISKSLADLGEELGKIAGILLTHEHADHVKGLRILTKNTGAPSERDDFGGISIREIVRTPLDTARFAIFPIYPWRRTIFTPIGRFFTWT